MASIDRDAIGSMLHALEHLLDTVVARDARALLGAAHPSVEFGWPASVRPSSHVRFLQSPPLIQAGT